MASNTTDEELMQRAQRGDDTAFAGLFKRYARPLLGYLNRLTGDVHLSEDLCQETFLRLYERRSHYRFPAPLRPYVYTIARNLLRNRWQRAPSERLEEAPERAAPVADPGRAAQTHDLLRRLQRAMERLPFEQREIITLRRFQDLRYAEIAEILGEPEGTLRSRCVRALAALGALIGKRPS